MTCTKCGGPIRRGLPQQSQAFRSHGDGTYEHVECPGVVRGPECGEALLDTDDFEYVCSRESHFVVLASEPSWHEARLFFDDLSGMRKVRAVMRWSGVPEALTVEERS